MPKLTERERLAELETRQQKLLEDIETARISVRSRYAAAIQDLPVEALTERELRELVQLSILLGGAPAIAALKPLVPAHSPGKKTAAPR